MGPRMESQQKKFFANLPGPEASFSNSSAAFSWRKANLDLFLCFCSGHSHFFLSNPVYPMDIPNETESVEIGVLHCRDSEFLVCHRCLSDIDPCCSDRNSVVFFMDAGR